MKYIYLSIYCGEDNIIFNKAGKIFYSLIILENYYGI